MNNVLQLTRSAALRSAQAACLMLLTHVPLVQANTNAYVEDGVVYESNGQEMRRFGVNYNTPFAFGYRSHLKLGIDPKHAIDMDVDHIARLGLDAYRVHVWDREITDAQGNLLNNVHLELFDYLMARLSEKGIKSIVTPMAWWGNGYPEPDQPNQGFAQHYSKAKMNQDEAAIASTVNYLKQLMRHKNRYTGQVMATDSNIIAFELFNEPKHTTEVQLSKAYINRLVEAMRQAEVEKPLFYNISEQGDWQEFADAVCQSDIDGIAFQWYPTGLVKMSRLNTNVLANVGKYHNPFKSINSCQNKAKMIYEFDAADVTRSVMYPAMARSLRAEGFQWATQFAYDPAETAHSNSEYNTHYLNLLYTPAKAVSLMIAAEAFRQLPRNYQQQAYPANNQFADISVDYHQDLSILNQQDKLYYSNSNQQSVSDDIKHIAGVGNSNVVTYAGSGAYFIDKIDDATWRLEVYPDVIKKADPHLPGSLQRTVANIVFTQQPMTLSLPGLNDDFHVRALNDGNSLVTRAEQGRFVVQPGIYLLSNKAVSDAVIQQIDSQFYLPSSVLHQGTPHVWHQAQHNANLGDHGRLSFDIVAPSAITQAKVYLKYAADNSYSEFDLVAKGQSQYEFTLPKDWTKTGLLQYRVSVESAGQWLSFPGQQAGKPSDWDFAANDAPWQLQLRPENTLVTLFDPQTDLSTLIYPKKGRSMWEFVSGDNGLGQALKLGLQGLADDNNWLLRSSFAEHRDLSDRAVDDYTHVVIKIRAHSPAEFVNFALLNQDGLAFGTTLKVSNNWSYKFIELSQLTPTATLLTKSYPMFLPTELPHQADKLGPVSKLQGFQVGFEQSKYSAKKDNKWHGIEIESVSLIKNSR